MLGVVMNRIGLSTAALLTALTVAGCSKQQEATSFHYAEPSRTTETSENARDWFLAYRMDSTAHSVPVFSYTVRKGDGVFKILSDELKGSKTFNRASDYVTDNLNNISMAADSILVDVNDPARQELAAIYALLPGSINSYEFDQCDVFMTVNPQFEDIAIKAGDCVELKVGEKISVPDLNGDGKIEGRVGKTVGNLTFIGKLYRTRVGLDPRFDPRGRHYEYRKDVYFEPTK